MRYFLEAAVWVVNKIVTGQYVQILLEKNRVQLFGERYGDMALRI